MTASLLEIRRARTFLAILVRNLSYPPPKKGVGLRGTGKLNAPPSAGPNLAAGRAGCRLLGADQQVEAAKRTADLPARGILMAAANLLSFGWAADCGEQAMIGRHNLPAMHILLAMSAGLLGFGGDTAAAQTFQDCSHCPSMVKVPAGTFMMGSSLAATMSPAARDEDVIDERPQHSVTIGREFAIGKYAVTRGEFAAFVKETGYSSGSKCSVYARDRYKEESGRSWRNPGYAQNDRHPAVCVSFEDAQHYVQWLSKKTGKSYRLPTEAEWEYAARAGTTTARFWGDDRDHACDFANVADMTGMEALNWNAETSFHCRDGYTYTSPVGTFKPNPFGLYDMLGNVWQWTEDCYHPSYDGAPSDGSAWTGGDCKYHVLRGSSWNNIAGTVRSAVRLANTPVARSGIYGFRVVRAP